MSAPRFAPLDWVRDYRRSDLKGDLVSGAVLAAVLVPQAMAYARVAGLPPITGLYAATVPLVVYAALGRSHTLGLGPVASLALLAAAGLSKLADAGSAEYVAFAATLALLTGVVHLVVGIARLGFVVRFLSAPVLRGFLAGLGITVIVTQVAPMLGYTVGVGDLTDVLGEVVRGLDKTSWAAAVLAASTLVVLEACRRVTWLPGPLVVVVAGIVLSVVLDLGTKGVPLVGSVPSELPGVAIPPLEFNAVKTLVPTALAISLISIVESWAMARRYALVAGYAVSADREITAVGAANVAAGVFQGMPVTGAISRATVGHNAGARTPLSLALAAAGVVAVLGVATGALAELPDAVLAALVVDAVIRFVNIPEARRLWRVKRIDFWLAVVAFVSTLGLGIELGVLLSVTASMLAVALRASRPHVTVRLSGRGDGVLEVRVVDELFFGNAEYLDEAIEAALEQEHDITTLQLDVEGVADLDSTADEMLRRLATASRDLGRSVVVSGAQPEVRAVMDASGLSELVTFADAPRSEPPVD
jgi:SulP family sulfate permease